MPPATLKRGERVAFPWGRRGRTRLIQTWADAPYSKKPSVGQNDHETLEGIMSDEFDGLDATEKVGIEAALNRCRGPRGSN
jgi:hypothetical protein